MRGGDWASAPRPAWEGWRSNGDKIWKILGSRKKRRSAKLRVRKIPFFSMTSQRGRQTFPNIPNFSLAVLGDSNGLEAKKQKNLAARFPSPFVRTGPIAFRKEIIIETERLRKNLFVPSSQAHDLTAQNTDSTPPVKGR